MKKATILLLVSLLNGLLLQAQVKIGDNPSTISPGSVLELESTSKALTLPRMTTVQMQAIPSPVNGMIIFNLDSNCIYFYKSNNVWAAINTSSSGPSTPWPYTSDPPGTPFVTGNAKGIIALTGTGLIASGDYSHAEGSNSVASGNYSWSVGNADTATANAAIAMGTRNKATALNSIAIGNRNVAALQSAIAMGEENQDSGWAAVAMGYKNRIGDQVYYSNTLGYNNEVRGGLANNAFGETNTISGGRANMATGINHVIAGNYNTALGSTHLIVAGNSNLLGGQSNKVEAGSMNILLGLNNTANANYSAALGNDNTTFYQSAIALGQGNRDSGWASVAGGFGNIISKDVKHSAAFGQNNLVMMNENLASVNRGTGTFSAGIGNVNSGYASIVLGSQNRSSSLFSLAGNYNTIANGYAMSAFGHFNDTTEALSTENYEPNEILFSIGNGTSNNNRRNSFTMQRNGFTSINTLTTPGPSLPRAELDVKGTGAIIVPVGTTEQRPVTPVVGMIRLCTDCGPGGTAIMQGYNGNAWVNL